MNEQKRIIRPVAAADEEKLHKSWYIYQPFADEVSAPISVTHERNADDDARKRLGYQIVHLGIQEANDEVTPIAYLEMDERQSEVLDVARSVAVSGYVGGSPHPLDTWKNL